MAVAGMTWVENVAGIREYEEHDPGLNAVLGELAQRAVAYAQSIAPVGSPADDDERPGAYRDSFKAAKRDDGPGWSFGSADNKAHWIEYGAAHMPKFAVLTRAAEQIRGG